MPRVDLQGLGQLLGAPGPVVVLEGTGQQVVESRVVGGFLGRLPERLGGQGVVFLLEGQLGRGEVGLDEVRAFLDGDVVELVEHLAGIGAAEEQVPAEHDAAFRRVIEPRIFRHELLEDLRHRQGVAEPAVGAIDVPAQEQQRQARGESPQAVFERGHRLGRISRASIRPGS